MASLDLTNQRFGRLTALARAERMGRRTAWRCRCECGNELNARTEDLRSGNTRSCGCLFSDERRAFLTTHGATHRHSKRDPVYRVWCTMKERCNNENSEAFPKYGGRGIRVCDRWAESFEAFRADMGPRPAGYSIDRIDGTKGYEPSNCRWATDKTQHLNRRSTIWVQTVDGQVCAADFAAQQGVSSKALYKVMKREGLDAHAACEYVRIHRRS